MDGSWSTLLISLLLGVVCVAILNHRLGQRGFVTRSFWIGLGISFCNLYLDIRFTPGAYWNLALFTCCWSLFTVCAINLNRSVSLNLLQNGLESDRTSSSDQGERVQAMVTAGLLSDGLESTAKARRVLSVYHVICWIFSEIKPWSR